MFTSIVTKSKTIKNILLSGSATLSVIGLILAATPLAASAQSITAMPGQRVTQPMPAQVRARLNSALSNSSNTSGSTTSNPTTYYYNWSGYAVTANSPFNQANMTYVQPSVTCPVPGAWTLFWVGFDGFNNGTVEQAGTAAECGYGANPTPFYYAWWEMYPTNTIQIMPLTIQPGDSIAAKVNYTASTKNYALSVHDVTSNKIYTQTTTCAANLICARQSAEWIDERPTYNGNYTPLANWNNMSLNNDQASNSTKLTYSGGKRIVTNILKPISAYSYTPIGMINANWTYLASVGMLNASGTNFTDQWLAVQ